MDFLSGKKIHEGKFSIVFLVEHKGEKLIVKQLHPGLSGSPQHIHQFRTEARLPAIEGINPRTLDYKEQNGNYYLIREFVDGITLKQIHALYTRKKYHSLYKDLYVQLCDKLSTLHSIGYIHCDVKPSNILFTGKDFKKDPMNVRLLDLGLSVRKDQLPDKKTGQPLQFSMLYSSPELMLNEPSFISEVTDLFSVGICMYESFSGENSYKENHPAVLLQMMLAVDLKKRRKIKPQLFDLISILSAKPGFKKPVAHYTVEEIKEYLRSNIQFRSQVSTVEILKEKLSLIS